MSAWTHRVLPDAAELPEVPPEMRPEEAQQWCNFVLWTPDAVPDGCELATGTVRMEAPPGRVGSHTAGRTPWSENNPSAYRFEVAGTGRRLRVKQFLYDWSFPALDHPSLWESAARAVPLDEHSVLWFGTDYLKNRAASARLARTTVELSVLEGAFTDAEILELYESLRPADPDAAEAIEVTPFAELSYWARRPDAAKVTVPVGLWTFRRRREHRSDWYTGDAARELVAELRLPGTLSGLDLDSAARFRDDEGREEIEAVYAGGPYRGVELRVIGQHAGRGSLRVPATPEADQPGNRSVETVRGAEVQLGWVDPDYGPFQAVFSHDGADLCLLSSSGMGLDRDWFRYTLFGVFKR